MTNEPDELPESDPDQGPETAEPGRGGSVASRVYAVLLAIFAMPIPLVLVFVIPAFKQMFEEVGIDLPLSTKFVLGLSGVFSDWFILAVPASLVVLGSLVALTFVNAELSRRREWTLALCAAFWASVALWLAMILGMLLPLVELIEKL